MLGLMMDLFKLPQMEGNNGQKFPLQKWGSQQEVLSMILKQIFTTKMPSMPS